MKGDRRIRGGTSRKPQSLRMGRAPGGPQTKRKTEQKNVSARYKDGFSVGSRAGRAKSQEKKALSKKKEECGKRLGGRRVERGPFKKRRVERLPTGGSRCPGGGGGEMVEMSTSVLARNPD